eukprot:1474414-Pyramimonas_sp.AAC.1
MSLDRAADSPRPSEFYPGNCWADWFASRGALEHACSETTVRNYEYHMSEVNLKARFHGWAAAKIAYGDSESGRPACT